MVVIGSWPLRKIICVGPVSVGLDSDGNPSFAKAAALIAGRGRGAAPASAAADATHLIYTDGASVLQTPRRVRDFT